MSIRGLLFIQQAYAYGHENYGPNQYCLLRIHVQEWVIIVKYQLSYFSAISRWEQVNFQWDDDEIRFVLA
jgi:hypothetical protein